MNPVMFQLSKVVNEIYHQYNRHQYPFVSLIVNMEKGKISGDFTLLPSGIGPVKQNF